MDRNIFEEQFKPLLFFFKETLIKRKLCWSLHECFDAGDAIRTNWIPDPGSDQCLGTISAEIK